MHSTNCRIRRTLGIDLGTTNSVIAMLDDSGSVLLTGVSPNPDASGTARMTFPSVVGWDASANQLVAGPEARALVSTQLPLSSVKRHMGLERRFPLGPHSLQAPEVSALILRGLRDWMARTLGDPRRLLDHAIITMPAYFNHNQIEATRQAGELAGFEVVELLHEPTAAAIYYSWLYDHGDATYLVYDLGGGTFDASIIRRRLGDHEVLSVSGDPFLGGDDFDRALASHLLEDGVWKWSDGGETGDLDGLFDPTRPEGAVPFARLVRLAEQIKIDLTNDERVDRYIPCVLTAEGRELSLEASVNRATFERLIRDKVERTIDCCHEALALARQRVGLGLGDIDHIVLVGGSSRLPLVRQVVREAFANPNLSQHARNSELLLHEPDLSVAYGAALRAASHGTRYLFPVRMGPEQPSDLELHITSPATTRSLVYQASGVVRGLAPRQEACSIRLRSRDTGLIDEVFLDEANAFVHDLELQPEADNRLEWTVCDGTGQPLASVVTTVRHQSRSRPLGQGVLPTQLITKPLSIEVLTRSRQRVKQIVAPVGAPLPGTFRQTCRTSDQSGRIVLPVCEENRVIKQLVICDIDSAAAIGTPVEIEFNIDVRHTISVSVRFQSGGRERRETAHIEPPPPPRRPTRAEIEQLATQLEAVLEQLSGRLRSRFKTRAQQLRQDLLEALSYDDEPRAIQRMAELGELVARAEHARSQALDPPWPRFAQQVRECLDLAAEVARVTDRDREELFEHVRAQERYAEQAYEDHHQALYRECWDNLTKYAGYLSQLLRDAIPRSIPRPTRSPEEEAKSEIEHFRDQLTTVWKLARSNNRRDLETRMSEIAKQGGNLTQRLKTEPGSVLRDARRLSVEIDKVRQQLEKPVSPNDPDHQGLLEGST